MSEKRLNKFQFTSSNCSDLIGVLKLEWFSLWESLPPSSNTKEKETINPTSEFSQLLLKYFERFLFLWLFLFQYEIRLFVLPCFFVTRQMAFPGRKLPLRATYLKVCEYLFRDLFLKKGESVPEVIQDWWAEVAELIKRAKVKN